MQINVTFPDGKIAQFNKNTTCLQVANSISPSLAKSCVVAKINNTIVDMSAPIEGDCSIVFITNNKEGEELLDVIRHDTAHVLAQALKELYPSVQITIGPSIENGFYYDIAGRTFSTDDFAAIEQKMHDIIKQNQPFSRTLMERDSAIEYFNSIGEKYKAKIIESIPQTENISIYQQGNFKDLCKGPHGQSTGYLGHFKLTKVAGAYWRGDSKNEMLQRIYGTAWASKKSLDGYLTMLEEAAKRDHRLLGQELQLFHQQSESSGDIFWHPNGRTLYRIIEDYMRKKFDENNYQEVKTPIMAKRELWEKSGHWEKFRENMFTSTVDEEEYAIKPMNCPCHVQIFNVGIRSYNDLPLRLAEFGCCHRYEPSGSLYGIMRVRSFVQDDAHIFCEEDQITSETISFCKMLTQVYKDFGFNDIRIKFSDRPQKRTGSDAVWDKAENALKEAVIAAGYDFEINKGEGAFYGPKLEFVLKDAIGRDWQCGTLQVDFVLPERLGAYYVNRKGEKVHPVMLHRAILGSMERFIGVLIEQHAGKFPLWLSPVQVIVCGVSNAQDKQVSAIATQLKQAGIRVKCDLDSNTVNYKIRKHSMQKINYILVIGEKEITEKTVCVRKLNQTTTNNMPLNEFIEIIAKECLEHL
jgi:threonyl-tRNA synthetase